MEQSQNKNEPLVSIIIPTYNRPEFLVDAITSALNQEYKNIEVIVSDDNSKNSPKDIAEQFHDSRLQFRFNKENLGMLGNNLKSFKEAKGKYVANLHDDDYWASDFLTKLIPILEADSSIIVAFCDHYIVDQMGKVNESASSLNTIRWKRDTLPGGICTNLPEIALIDKSIPIVMAAVMRKDYIDWALFEEKIGPAYDLFLSYLVVKSGKNAYYFPEKLTYYRVHSTNTSSSKNVKWFEGILCCYDKFVMDPELQDIHKLLEEKLAQAHYDLGIAYLKSNNKAGARKHLISILKVKKGLKAFLGFILTFFPSFFIKLIL